MEQNDDDRERLEKQETEVRIKGGSQKSGARRKGKKISKCGLSLIFWLLTPDF
jgi:hypothetical protein